jgi:serine/threonine protein kinase/beta-lactam-binding protein with PASTA domain
VAPVAEFLADRYEVGERLGSGGMGDVYRARDRLLERPVAVKVPTATITPSSAERFKREARAAARLNHPNVVGVYDWGASPTPFIVMELVDGHSLRAAISERGKLPPTEVATIGAQIADALAHAHHHGVIHRDVKPSNVLLTRAGTVKVTDFGIAQSSVGEALTAPGVVLGTIGYLSPEQVAGLPADERSDVYSLGIVLAELLTGERPDGSEDAPVTELARIVARAHATDPSARYQRAAELADALRSAALPSDTPVTARVVVTPTATVAIAPSSAPATVATPTAVLPPARLAPIAVSAGKAVKARKAPKPVKPLKPPKPRRRARVKTATSPGMAVPSPRPHNWRARHYVVILAAPLLLAAGGVIAYVKLTDHPPIVAVPSVVDRDVFSAIAVMHQQGLLVRGQEADSPQPGGVILAQSPKRGQRLEQGSVVRLTVSSTRATVPDVFSLDEAAARAALAERGLINVTVTPDYRDDLDAGTVVSTSPAPFRKALKNAPLILVVARDPHVKVASVVGLDQATATDRLHGQGLEVTVQTASSRGVAAGFVTKMSPGANQTLVRGDTVTLTVSSGPKLITVPSTVLDDRGDAIAQLEDDGFAVVVTTAPSSSAQDGKVLTQTPPGGQAPQGSTVTITVGVKTKGK